MSNGDRWPRVGWCTELADAPSGPMLGVAWRPELKPGSSIWIESGRSNLTQQRAMLSLR